MIPLAPGPYENEIKYQVLPASCVGVPVPLLFLNLLTYPLEVPTNNAGPYVVVGSVELSLLSTA